MDDREFNLITEKWIKVLNQNDQVEEVSLENVLTNTKYYKALAGECSQQDITVFRFLLAVVYTITWRYDEEGTEDQIDTPKKAKDRWSKIWKAERFPEAAVQKYLTIWKDRFWLFDKKYPFGQTSAAVQGSEFSSAKLIGDIFESGNKMRIFSFRTDKEKVPYAEAARWCFFLNGFDDCASKKPKGKIKKCYLSRLGLITAVGNNLFESLMLNLPLLKSGIELWGEDPKPVWERDIPPSGHNVEILQPDNLAELLTVQSRRILLRRSGQFVTGYYDMAGDILSEAPSEPMTVFCSKKDESGNVIGFIPAAHDPQKQMWRNFSALVAEDKSKKAAGIISWIAMLKNSRILKKGMRISFKVMSVEYGSMNSGIVNSFEDSLTVYAGLLANMQSYLPRITNEIALCEKVARIIGQFSLEAAYAAGVDKKHLESRVERYKELFYYLMDIPCRKWLASLDPESEDVDFDEEIKKWRNTIKKTAFMVAKQIIEDAGQAAVIGKKSANEELKGMYIKPGYVTAPDSFRRLKVKLSTVLEE